jgi:putative membrane protein
MIVRPVRLGSGVIVLALAWLGPLPDAARGSFTAHMTMHMAVVAVAAPLLAMSLAGSALDPVRAAPLLFPAIPASIVELVVVWTWHVPALHHAARHDTSMLVLEQASFLAAGLLLWLAVCGGGREGRRARAGAGVVALLFTSMHMTLLGALFALATRPLFRHPAAPGDGSLADQHLGGAIMLLVGGAAYLAGGLWLAAGMLSLPRCAWPPRSACSSPAPFSGGRKVPEIRSASRSSVSS